MAGVSKQKKQDVDKRYIFEEMPVPRAPAHFMVPTVLSQMAALALALLYGVLTTGWVGQTRWKKR